MALQISAANKQAFFQLMNEFMSANPMIKAGFDAACNARALPAATTSTAAAQAQAANGATTMGGGYNLPVPTWTPASSNGSSPTGGNGNGCGCGPKPGQPMVPGGPQYPSNGGGCSTGSCGINPNGNNGYGAYNDGAGNCGIPVPPGPSAGTPIPVSQQVGSWNCQALSFNLAPCDIARIMREKKLPTVVGTISGPIAQGDVVAIELAPVLVSHSLCVDFIKVEVTNDEVPPVTTTLEIAEIAIQGEMVAQDGNGPYAQVWQYRDPERPQYLGITDGRCACLTLCACVPALAHARLVFTLPQAVGADETLTVTLWGRRKDWMVSCGPCPPCLICDHERLTPEEIAAATDQVYVID